MTLFQHHLLALGTISVTTLGLALFILWKNPRENLHRSMALYCFSLAWWSGWECAALQMPTRELAYQLLRVEYVGVSFIPTLLCTVNSFLLHLTSKTRRALLSPLYFGSLVSLFATSIHPTKDFLGVAPGPVAYLPIWGLAGPHYWIFLVFFIGSLLLGIGMIFYGWQRAMGQERTRLALFLVGSLVAYLGACPEFALKYGIRLGWLNPFGLYGVPIFIGLLVYAIVQHNFLNIRVAVRKSLIYSILVTFLTVGYFGLIFVLERIFQTTFGYHSILVSVVAFALMALVFQPLQVGVQRFVDWMFFRAPQEELIRRIERLEQETRQTEKLKAIATLAAGMAHEIKNPLSSIKTFTDFLPQKYDDPAFRAKFTKIMKHEVEKIDVLVRRLLDFAKPARPKMRLVRLSRLIDDTVDLLHGALMSKHIKVEKAYSLVDEVEVDAVQIKQVFLNLILNSIEAMDKQGCISITTIRENGHVEAQVIDTGPGIPKKDLPRVFDPFYTTKPQGTGLGLSVVHGIVREHGGHIIVDSDTGRGTLVRIQLPAV